MSLEQTRVLERPQAGRRRLRTMWPKITRRSGAVWLHEFFSWRRYYRSSILLNFGEPILNLIALGWGLGAYIANIGDHTFLQFIGPGLLAVTAMNSVTYDTCYEGYDRLNRTGLFTAMTSTSMDTGELVGGYTMWEVTRSLLYGGIFFVVLMLFGIVESWWSVGILLSLVLSGVLFGLAGLIVVGLAKTHEHLYYYFSLGITPMFLFSGIFFPIERLPTALQWVAQGLPLFHLVEINRAFISGNVDLSLLTHIGVLLAMIAILAPFPARFIGKALEQR